MLHLSLFTVVLVVSAATTKTMYYRANIELINRENPRSEVLTLRVFGIIKVENMPAQVAPM